MLFAAGMGIGLVFWGVAEPLSHYAARPPGVAPGTPEAANVAMRYAFFHWGLHPWAIYGVVGLAMAFFQFRRGGSALVSTRHRRRCPGAGPARLAAVQRAGGGRHRLRRGGLAGHGREPDQQRPARGASACRSAGWRRR